MILSLLVGTLAFDYVNRAGLTVNGGGLELAKGSFVQFYAPGWSKGYYSSNWNDQQITKNADGSMTVVFKSTDGRAEARQTLRPAADGFTVDYWFLWRGTEPCLVENTVGMLKVRPFQTFTAGDHPVVPVGLARTGSEDARRLHPEAQPSFAFASRTRNLTVSSSLPFVAFDARGWNQDWARAQDVIWMGHPALELKKDVPLELSVTWKSAPQMLPMLGTRAVKAREVAEKEVIRPFKPEGIQKMKLSGKPKLGWRGVHLFVGPQSEAVHARLAKDVFPALRINKVLLQCEQSKWSILNTDRLTNFTSLASLKRIFATYRRHGIEPIPLIQSFGHMEWFFAGGQNLSLAHNPKVPYAIDPRKPEAVAAILKIWDEAIALLKPKEIHFGLDEVDMRGFPDDPALTTELWRIMLPQLSDYAARQKLPFMLWGDKLLAPGQAPDAALGDNKEEAARRREVVPKTATITDWHYLNNPNPAVYNNVKLWREWGYPQIGSVWNRPDNVYGYTHAIINSGERGMLQTIWAGYYLSERSMLDNWGQYASAVLLADYSYSGRMERPKDLPYQPETVLRDLWVGPERRRLAGATVQWAESTESLMVGGTKLARQSPLEFYDAYTGENPQSTMTLPLSGDIAEAHILLRSKNPVGEGKSVLLATVGEEDQSVHYGWDFRALDDARPLFRGRRSADGYSLAVVRFAKGTGSELVLRQVEGEAGVEIAAISLVPRGKSR